MRFLGRIFTLLFSLTGLAVFSQAPEFAQQYRQRLGGAVEELRVVVADFDADASRSSMTREEALSEMKSDDAPFVRDRGTSMGEVIDRFGSLERQLGQIDRTPSLARPLVVMQSPDRRIVSDAWQVFEPAVPLTIGGGVWGGAGFVLGFLTIWLTRKASRRLRRNDGGKIRVGNATANEIPDGIFIEAMPSHAQDNGEDGAEKTAPPARNGLAMMAVKPGPDG
ncbi:MAG: DUF2937 family protein [Nitratireductor sp.]